jgi:hypothetical protein
MEQTRKTRGKNKVAPSISPDELKSLREGNFGSFDSLRCTALLAAVLATYSTKTKLKANLNRRDDKQGMRFATH